MSSQHTRNQTHRTRWRKTGTALASLTAIAILTLPAAGQDQGGLLLRFGVTQELGTNSNPSLAVGGSERENQARTRLSFTALNQTPIDTLSLSVDGVLEFGDGRQNGLSNPGGALSWRREVANSALDLRLGLREREVEDIDFGLGLDPLTGGLVVTTRPGTGTERVTNGNVSLELGRQSPFGATFALGRTDTEYFDATDPNLEDQERTTARATLRFDLSPVTTANLSLSTAQLDRAVSGRSDTDTLGLSLTTARPDGDLSANLNFDDTAGGRRSSFSLGRTLDLPSGSIGGTLGVVRDTGGETSLIASLDWLYALPRGELTLGFDQTVLNDADDVETEVRALEIGLTQSLTPRVSAELGLSYTQRDSTASDLDTTNISAGVNYALDENWSLALDANHRIRDEQGVGRANSTSLSLSVSRTFDWRP